MSFKDNLIQIQEDMANCTWEDGDKFLAIMLSKEITEHFNSISITSMGTGQGSLPGLQFSSGFTTATFTINENENFDNLFNITEKEIEKEVKKLSDILEPEDYSVFASSKYMSITEFENEYNGNRFLNTNGDYINKEYTSDIINKIHQEISNCTKTDSGYIKKSTEKVKELKEESEVGDLTELSADLYDVFQQMTNSQTGDDTLAQGLAEKIDEYCTKGTIQGSCIGMATNTTTGISTTTIDMINCNNWKSDKSIIENTVKPFFKSMQVESDKDKLHDIFATAIDTACNLYVANTITHPLSLDLTIFIGGSDNKCTASFGD